MSGAGLEERHESLMAALRRGGNGEHVPGPDSKIEFTKAELAVIDFRPGDTAVLMFPGHVAPEKARWIAEVWKSINPDIKCIVLQDGARLGVVRAVDE